MLPARGDAMLTTAEAALVAGVAAGTIRAWASRGRLKNAGYDERGWPLYELQAVQAAEERVRDNGITRSGIDPRRLRGIKPAGPKRTRRRADRNGA